MIIRVDIDETICTHDEKRYYPDAKPLYDRINVINDLYEAGHTIVYWTARGAITGKDWFDLTVSQLNEWGAKFHSVELGKPHYDLYIDDKSISSETFFSTLKKITKV